MNRRQWRETRKRQAIPGQEDDYDLFFKYWRRYKWFQLIWPTLIAAMIVSTSIDFGSSFEFWHNGGLFLCFGIPIAVYYFFLRPYLKCPECKLSVVSGVILYDLKFIYTGDCPHCGNKIKV